MEHFGNNLEHYLNCHAMTQHQQANIQVVHEVCTTIDANMPACLHAAGTTSWFGNIQLQIKHFKGHPDIRLLAEVVSSILLKIDIHCGLQGHSGLYKYKDLGNAQIKCDFVKYLFYTDYM